MHPKKADLLTRLEDASRVHDAALERSFNVVKNPGEFGWERSIPRQPWWFRSPASAPC